MDFRNAIRNKDGGLEPATDPALHFTPQFVQQYSEELSLIVAELEGWDIHETYCAIPTHLMPRHSSTLVLLAQLAGKDAQYILKHVPETLLETHPPELKDFIQLHQSKLVAGASLEQIGKASDPVQEFEKTLSLYRDNNEHYGTTFFHRYFGTSLLEENLRNLDSSYHSERPIAVLIQNKHDPPVIGEQFASSIYMDNIAQRIGGNYKLFAFETDNSNEAFEIIRRIGSDYGLISLLLLAGHGNKTSLQLGAKTCDLNNSDEISTPELIRFISVLNEPQFIKHAKYLKSDASIGLLSCNTGKGRKRAKNLANCISKAIPGRKVFAAASTAHMSRFQIHLENGLVSSMGYHIAPSIDYCALTQARKKPF